MIDSAELKKLFIELLERDAEFRYATLGLLGLDRFEKSLIAILEEIRKIWEEIRVLREEQGNVWREIKRVWNEVKALRESQDRVWDEVRLLREECRKLWEEVKALRESQEKLWLEVKALREDQKELRRDVGGLRISQERLHSDVDRLRRYVKHGFDGLKRALGMSFEKYMASFIEFLLFEQGFEGAKVVVRKQLVYEGRTVEINLFCEEPLVVGEATLVLGTIAEAEEEVRKLLERIEIVSRIYGRKPYMSVLAVGSAPKEVVERLREATSKHGIKLIIGREVKELF